MYDLIIHSIFVALVSTSIILMLKRSGFLEALQLKAPPMLSELAGCDFCLAFWLSVAATIFLIASTGDGTLSLIPFLSTPVVRFLL